MSLVCDGVCVRFLPFSVLASLLVGVQDVRVRRLRELAAEEEERKAREALARERGLEGRHVRSIVTGSGDKGKPYDV